MQTHHLRSVWHRQIGTRIVTDDIIRQGFREPKPGRWKYISCMKWFAPLHCSPWNWRFFYILYYTESDIWIIHQCIYVHWLIGLGVLCHGCSDKNSSKECGAFHVKNCSHVKDLLCTCWITVYNSHKNMVWWIRFHYNTLSLICDQI